jgi:hypothetical protein
LSNAGGRRRVAGGLSAAAVLLATVWLVLAYAGHAILRPQPFADRAVAALRDSAVQADLADHLADAIVSSGNGDLVTLRPIVRSITGSIVGSNAFAALFRHAILSVHRAVIEHPGNSVVLKVDDAAVLVAAGLESLAPASAETIGAEGPSQIMSVSPSTALLEVARTAKRVLSLAWILVVLAAISVAGAIRFSPDRRHTTRSLGAGLLTAGLALAVLVTAGGVVAVASQFPGEIGRA